MPQPGEHPLHHLQCTATALPQPAGMHGTHRRCPWSLALGINRTALLGPSGHLRQKALPSILGEEAVLANTNEQTRRQAKWRDSNRLQTKVQDKTSEKDLYETKISHLPDKEFKLMVLKMVTKLRRTQRERRQRERKHKKVPERSHRVEECKNWTKKIHWRDSTAYWMKQKNNVWARRQSNRTLPNRAAKKKKMKREKGPSGNENTWKDTQGNAKWSNTPTTGVPEEKERWKGAGNLCEEIMAENFLNLEKKTDIQVQEAQSSKRNKPKEIHTKKYHS